MILSPLETQTGCERVRLRPVLVVTALLCAMFSLTPTTGTAALQRDEKPPKVKDERWRKDPFTKNDPKKLDALGYVRVENISWTHDYGSDRIEQALGDVKIRWIETKHFRLGCSLKTWSSVNSSKDERKRIRDELKRLKKKLPTVKPNEKKQSPWLRAHLYAQRLEEIWERVSKVLNVTDESFPSPKGEKVNGEFMGQGPYFGSKAKFGVLLLEKESSCARYLKTFTGSTETGPSRWYTYTDDMMIYAIASEIGDGIYADDSRMYTTVMSAIATNMLEAYRSFYRPPPWWQEGLVHSLRRELTTEFNNFSQIADRQEWVYSRTDWETRLVGYIKNDATRPSADLFIMPDCSKMKFGDHLAIWSRVEFLRGLGDKKFARFAHVMKGLHTATGEHPPLKYMVDQQKIAFKEIWGFGEYQEFDEAWIRWAKKEYRGK